MLEPIQFWQNLQFSKGNNIYVKVDDLKEINFYSLALRSSYQAKQEGYYRSLKNLSQKQPYILEVGAFLHLLLKPFGLSIIFFEN